MIFSSHLEVVRKNDSDQCGTMCARANLSTVTAGTIKAIFLSLYFLASKYLYLDFISLGYSECIS